MKRGILVSIFVVFLIAFMVGEVNADYLSGDSYNFAIKEHIDGQAQANITFYDYSIYSVSYKPFIIDYVLLGDFSRILLSNLSLQSKQVNYQFYLSNLKPPYYSFSFGDIGQSNYHYLYFNGTRYKGLSEMYKESYSDNVSSGNRIIGVLEMFYSDVFMSNNTYIKLRTRIHYTIDLQKLEPIYNESWLVYDVIIIDNANEFEQNQRLSILESWQQTINNNQTNIFNILSNQATKINSFETRLTVLENKNCSCQPTEQETFPSYLMKLSSADRKDIVCAYGEEKHLYGVDGLGWTCGLTYKTSNSGRVSVSCKCKK